MASLLPLIIWCTPRLLLLALVVFVSACGGGGGGGGAANTDPVVEITSLQADDQFNVRAPVLLEATASDAEDGSLTASVEWNSSRDGDLGKSGSLTLSTLTEGFHTITAAVRDTGRLRVTDTVLIRIFNDKPELEAGVAENRTEVVVSKSLTLQAIASDTEDGDLSSAAVWSSNLEGELGAGASLAFSFAVVDTQLITASVTDADGKSATVEFEIDVLPLPDNLYIKASNTEPAGASCAADKGCDNFGLAVALSDDGSTLAVGAPLEDGNTNSLEEKDSGAVYVYRNDGAGTWVQEALLRSLSLTAFDQFGAAVSISADGSTLAVGAATANSGAGASLISNSGSAYVFSRDGGGNWAQDIEIESDNALTKGAFGASVSLNAAGDVLAVGAPGEEAAYLYTKLAGAWPVSADQMVEALNGDPNDNFGRAVALDDAGNTLVVGASQEGSASATDQTDDSAEAAGAAYVFQLQAGVWSQAKYLKSADIQVQSRFGAAVAISSAGDRVAVGAPAENLTTVADGSPFGDEGVAYVFADNGADWILASRAKAANHQPGDGFGNALALTADGQQLFIGARAEDSQGKNVNGSQTNDYSDPVSGTTDYNDADSGAVYKFNVSAAIGTQETYYKAFNSAEGDKFGTALAIDAAGSKLAVGANLEDGSGQGVDAALDNVPGLQAGAVYLFQ